MCRVISQRVVSKGSRIEGRAPSLRRAVGGVGGGGGGGGEQAEAEEDVNSDLFSVRFL